MTPEDRAKLRAATENTVAGHWRGTDLSLITPANIAALLDAADRADELQARLDAVLAVADAFLDDTLPLYDVPAAIVRAARGEQA